MLFKVEEKLNEYGIEIIHKYDTDLNSGIITDNMNIMFNEDNNLVIISFHVVTPIKEVANMILILKEIDNINIVISDVFIYVNGKFLLGDEAINHIEEKMTKHILHAFIEEQKKQHMLAFSSMGEC